tara:strand:- start:27992 stop:28285 length:294 start_codon:yes stop_codon:yes gene_type:complete
VPRDAVRRAADGSRRVPFLAWRLVRVAGVSFCLTMPGKWGARAAFLAWERSLWGHMDAVVCVEGGMRSVGQLMGDWLRLVLLGLGHEFVLVGGVFRA